jgi:S1-C subfamily serine protease
MKRAPLYSRSTRPAAAQAEGRAPTGGPMSAPARGPAPAVAVAAEGHQAEPPLSGAEAPRAPGRLARWHTALRPRPQTLGLWLGTALMAASAATLVHTLWAPAPPPTQADVERAVKATLKKAPLPSNAARAYRKIAPSVVQVRGDDGEVAPTDITHPHAARGGTGVVINERGVILTSLHVVEGSQRIEVVFADGSTSPASIVSVRAEDDLAVLQARKLPDDLVAATLRTTGDLVLGDEVIAVGFPFGLGPSVSSGVVSGLKREFHSPDGEQVLRNLIQFDAAANPGNSGGPLVTSDGEVVGIVAAILNPSAQHTFIGIGFAVPIENAAAAAGLPPH